MLPPANARGLVNIKRLMDYVAERYRINSKLFSDPEEALEWLINQGKSTS
jgi:GTP cyclohydrolase I